MAPDCVWGVTARFKEPGALGAIFYLGDDGLQLMSLWTLNQLSACLNMVTWVQRDKDRKRLKSSACLSAIATCRGKIELGGRWSIKCPNNIHFLKCLSVFSTRNERNSCVEKWKEEDKPIRHSKDGQTGDPRKRIYRSISLCVPQ